jgi:hypothetical protein
MSAYTSKADFSRTPRHVSFVPIGDVVLKSMIGKRMPWGLSDQTQRRLPILKFGSMMKEDRIEGL